MHEMYCEKSREELHLCTEAIFIVLSWGDNVDCIGLPYRPARLRSRSQLYPPVRDYEFGYRRKPGKRKQVKVRPAVETSTRTLQISNYESLHMSHISVLPKSEPILNCCYF
jgi:hypothetical protein